MKKGKSRNGHKAAWGGHLAFRQARAVKVTAMLCPVSGPGNAATALVTAEQRQLISAVDSLSRPQAMAIMPHSRQTCGWHKPEGGQTLQMA